MGVRYQRKIIFASKKTKSCRFIHTIKCGIFVFAFFMRFIAATVIPLVCEAITQTGSIVGAAMAAHITGFQLF
jgi:hypothetical protein